jgi:hypothetical protein
VKVHELKCWPEFFQAIRYNLKRHEVRHNDRDYQVGDVLWLQEWDPKTKAYTGQYESVLVTYLARGGECPGLENVPASVVVMSIAKWDIDRATGDQGAQLGGEKS